MSKMRHPERSEGFHRQQATWAINDGPMAKKLKAKNYDEIFLEEMNQWKDAIGIFCASENYSNILLWSHYADNHNGFCVRLKSEGILDAVQGDMGPVIYNDQIPELIPKNNKDMSEIIPKFYTKYSGWDYEEEIRFTALHKANKIVEIDPQIIEAIYFGSSMNSESKLKKVEELQGFNHLSHIEYYEMKMNFTEYELEALRLKLNLLD